MNLTKAQEQARTRTGASILVSAAAGSGKTSVLAERCAYLVTDAQPRCSIDRLLVLTFADAAANEMRSRIEQAIAMRYEQALQQRGSQTQYLKHQAMLTSAAHISTIHSFCARLIRQNFHTAGLDPSFRVLDGAEAQLLREEVAEALFEDRLEGADGAALREFIDLYGDGSDEPLRARVVQTHETLSGVVDRERWRTQAMAALTEVASSSSLTGSGIGRDYLALIKRELEGMLSEAQAIAQTVAAHTEPGPYAAVAQEMGALIADCIGELDAGKFDAVSQRLRAGLVSRLGKKHGIPAEMAKALQERLARLRKDLCNDDGALYPLFALEERRLIDDVGRTLPHATVFLDLVWQFKDRYDQAKRGQNALDFSDLEHTTLDLLGTSGGPGEPRQPSNLARRLHERYEHVLVDEYQDINPVQEEILRLTSRECRRDEGVAGNLFCVGDVKQSIYRFRLAEPNLFLGRGQRYRGGTGGVAIELRENFRTRWPLLQAINGVFRRLMTGQAAEIEYAAGHEFASIMEYPEVPEGFTGTPIELHLLDKDKLAQAANEAQEPSGDDDQEDELEMAEMEARHVANLVRDLLIPADGKLKQIYLPKENRFRAIEPNDIAILLRATRFRTREFAQAFARLGIPMRSENRSGFFKAVEVQEVLAILKVLDNQQQDIPLAAVLRSPIACIDEPEDALARIALAYKEIPFHQAVTKYAQEQTADLAAKLRAILDRLADWRLLALQRSTEELIATIYRQTSLPAWYAALPNGQQRLANLNYLQQSAARFATFSRQGLYRFLRFLEEMEERDSLAQPPAGNEGQAVKLMTVHAAKGLEYPVVIVAGLGSKLNLSDGTQTLLLHRDRGLALRVADTQTNTRYPGIASHVIEAQITRAALAEELRVLYVAMTRAREQLILVGAATTRQIDRWHESVGDAPLSEHSFLAGRKFLDWLGPVFSSGKREQLQVRVIESMPKPPPRSATAKSEALAPLDAPSALPNMEVVNHAIARLQYRYPSEPSTHLGAAVSVTALSKGTAPIPAPVDADSNEIDLAAPFEAPAFAAVGQVSPGDEAAARGTATHLVMQHLDLSLPAERVGQQIQQMTSDGMLSPDQAALVNEADIVWFLGTPTGQLLQTGCAQVHRELPFLDAFTSDGRDASTGMDRVMVRGRIDVAVPHPDGWLIIDYKTDRNRPEPGGERFQAYQKQVSLYCSAIERSGLGKVAGVRLVFLRARQILEM